MKMKTMFLRMVITTIITIGLAVSVIIVFAVADYVGELTLPEKAEAQTVKTYQIRILGDIKGVMRYGFKIEATEFFETWDGGYYRFTKLNGEQVYYPVSRTIVTVKP